MAVKGKPYLAVGIAGNVNLFRMDVNNVFQASGAQGVPFQTLDNIRNSLDFIEDTNLLNVQYGSGANLQSISTYQATTTLTGVGNVSAFVNSTETKAAQFNPGLRYGFTDMVTSGAGLSIVISDLLGNLTTVTGAVLPKQFTNLLTPKYAFHPTGRFAYRPVAAGSGVSPRIIYDRVYAATPELNGAVAVDALLVAAAATFSRTGTRLFTLTSDGIIRVHGFTKPTQEPPSGAQVLAAVTPNLSSITELGLGVGERIYTSKDGAFLYAVFNNAGVRTTVVYDRVGDTLVRRQQINTFGTLLDITFDGKYLIDASQKKAYHYENGTYVDVSATVMVNIPASVFVQGISYHIDARDGALTIYDKAPSKFFTCGVDYANLRLKLLRDDAVMVPGATTIAQAVGSYSIIDTNMPATGLPLTGAAIINNVLAVPTAVSFTPAAATSFRYAVIVDQTNDSPIAYIDYGSAIAINPDLGIQMLLGDPGLIAFTQ